MTLDSPRPALGRSAHSVLEQANKALWQMEADLLSGTQQP